MKEVLDESHNYNAAATDAWVAWLEDQYQKWTAYFAKKNEPVFSNPSS